MIEEEVKNRLIFEGDEVFVKFLLYVFDVVKKEVLWWNIFEKGMRVDGWGFN